MKDISQYIKKIHKESNLILKKNFVYYCIFKFYNSEYKEKLSKFFITFFIFIWFVLSTICSIFFNDITSYIEIELLELFINFFGFILILFIFGVVFMKCTQFLIFIIERITNFIIKRIENYILNRFSGVDKNILDNIEHLFFFIGRSINDIEESLNQNMLDSDINLLNISYDLILKFEKEEKINKF